ncbi:MAG: hypothetical protein ACLFVJ_04545 [Persicimonas sp.]
MLSMDRLRSYSTERVSGADDRGAGFSSAAWLVAGLVALLGFGCGESGDADDDFDSAQMRLAAASSLNNAGNRVNFTDADGALFSLTSAKLVIKSIHMTLPDDVACGDVDGQLQEPVGCGEAGPDADGDQLEIRGPFVADLIAGTTEPDWGTIAVPALDYQGFEIDIELGDQTDTLMEHAFIGEADFEFENQKRQLLMQYALDIEADLDRPDIVLEGNQILVVQFDAARWLEYIPVTSCMMRGQMHDEDGRVTIDARVGGECEESGPRFRENFRKSIKATVDPGEEWSR